MDMPMGSSSSNVTMMMMMKPYLHFTGGDVLFFKSWVPSSPGAIAGASIGLFFLAIFERWLSSMRGIVEEHWRRSALRLPDASQACQTDSFDGTDKGTNETTQAAVTRARRAFAFIPAQDFPRGGLYAFSRLLGYLLMLTAMTYQAAYIIAIVLGAGAGEIAFGRWGSSSGH